MRICNITTLFNNTTRATIKPSDSVYQVVFKDLDTNTVLSVRYVHTYDDAVKLANDYLGL